MRDELYHQAILDLAARAKTQPRLERPDVTVTVDNPLCGDRITLDLAIADGLIREAGHRTRGCLLCQASAAAITERAPGAAPDDLRGRREALARALAAEPFDSAELWPELAAFAPVQRHKSRHDCVLLPFEALEQALDQSR